MGELSFVLSGTHFLLVYESICHIIHASAAKVGKTGLCQHDNVDNRLQAAQARNRQAALTGFAAPMRSTL